MMISLTHLGIRARTRATGYADAVFARATSRSETHLTVADDVWRELEQAFPAGHVRPVKPTVQTVLCTNCGGQHATAACPIPPNYDGKDYKQDSRGTSGCGCAG